MLIAFSVINASNCFSVLVTLSFFPLSLQCRIIQYYITTHNRPALVTSTDSFSEFGLICHTIRKKRERERLSKLEQSCWLRGKEVFFTLWLGTPVTLPLLLSRENSSPHPCSGGVKQCSRWMGLSTSLDAYMQNIKCKITNAKKTSPEILARYKFVKSSLAHICTACSSPFVRSCKQECRPPRLPVPLHLLCVVPYVLKLLSRGFSVQS